MPARVACGGRVQTARAYPVWVRRGAGIPGGGRAELRARCAEAFGFSGQLVEVRLREGPVVLAVTVDAGERSRRQDGGLGAVCDREALTALWELPVGLPVPAESAPNRVAEAVAGVPDAFAERRGGDLVRLARPPVRFGGALSVGRTVRCPLERVGQVSALCPMGIAVLGGAEPDDPHVLEAGLYGVGVAHVRAGGVEVAAEPAGVQPTPGPFLWWVAEKAYERCLGG